MAPDPLATIDIRALLVGMRPKLYRYCARMVGSVVDGGDVLIKAMEALQSVTPVTNPEGWLFRIAHNTVPASPTCLPGQSFFAMSSKLTAPLEIGQTGEKIFHLGSLPSISVFAYKICGLYLPCH